MLLKNKNAVIYGAGGAIGSAVALAFAREGATVFLAGNTSAKLDAVAQQITNAGGSAETAQVDALDNEAIEDHLSTILSKAGTIDISFNAIGLGDTQGAPLIDMQQERFALPISTAMQTHFFTATAAARQMAKQRSGVIMAITANVARVPEPNVGGFGVACAAIESLCRQLAVEVGPLGIRVICLRSAGSPDAPGVREAFKLRAAEIGTSLEEFTAYAAREIPLRHLPLLAEVANVAAFMASDQASAMTGAVANVTCGQIID
ncbi:MAG: SDR family oxidoreductase [Anaerolineae bacterium]|nr:SDR family oxidoreductase [Anaerolineae bacterium]